MTDVDMNALTEQSEDKSPEPAQGAFDGSSSDRELSNPMGTDGFEFVEYTAPDPRLLRQLFEMLGFRPIARHRSKDVTLYSQGGVNFLINGEQNSFAQAFAKLHGPSICAMAIPNSPCLQRFVLQRPVLLDFGQGVFTGDWSCSSAGLARTDR